MEISVSKLRNNDLLEQMRFFWCADKENFTNAFKQLGFPIENESDLLILENWNKTGIDTSGNLKTPKGDIVKIDIKDFVNNSIKLRHNKLVNCNLKFVA